MRIAPSHDENPCDLQTLAGPCLQKGFLLNAYFDSLYFLRILKNIGCDFLFVMFAVGTRSAGLPRVAKTAVESIASREMNFMDKLLSRSKLNFAVKPQSTYPDGRAADLQR